MTAALYTGMGSAARRHGHHESAVANLQTAWYQRLHLLTKDNPLSIDTALHLVATYRDAQ